MKTARSGAAALAGALTLTLVAGSVGTAAGATPARPAAKALPAAELALVSYSTPQAAFEEIIKAFNTTTVGKNITFTQSYGASGEQSRAVASGQKADVVEFSLEPDMTRLVDANLVAKSWNKNAYHGFVTNSVVVIGTRSGNPKHLKTWTDLTKSGVEVITPNPFTSGGARWNLMAGYGGVSNVGKSPAKGTAWLTKTLANTPVQDDSARASLQTFTGGKGDAILSYENDLIFAEQKGQAVAYTIPTGTILIQNPVAVTKTSAHPRQAKAFVAFLYTKTAQKIFARNGYRPVVPGVAKQGEFPTPKSLFTIDQLGGWPAVTKRFFDPATGVVAKIERDNVVPTSR